MGCVPHLHLRHNLLLPLLSLCDRGLPRYHPLLRFQWRRVHLVGRLVPLRWETRGRCALTQGWVTLQRRRGLHRLNDRGGLLGRLGYPYAHPPLVLPEAVVAHTTIPGGRRLALPVGAASRLDGVAPAVLNLLLVAGEADTKLWLLLLCETEEAETVALDPAVVWHTKPVPIGNCGAVGVAASRNLVLVLSHY